MMWILIVILVLTVLCYVVHKQNKYWKKRGVPGPTPLPFIGNMGKHLIGKASIGEIVADIYSKYEKYPFVGIYKLGIPCLLIRDIDFIKNITGKDFKYFEDNEQYLDKNVDPLLGRNPFFLRGDEWRKSRSQLTPGFTSGKMKLIFPLLEEVGKRMTKYVATKKEAISTGMEAEHLCFKFTLDNVALCAFGIEAKCFGEAKSEFEDLVRKFFTPAILKLVMLLLVPSLANFVSTKIVPKDVDEKIMALVETTIKYRKENNVVRNDFLDFVNQLSKTSPNYTQVDIAAHATSFLADGVETSSHVMSFLLFELASNPKVQTKLREEINNTFDKNNQQLSYESIQEMAYLDACLNESMRKNAPVFFLTKVCTAKYTYTPNNPDYESNAITVEPGTVIVIPTRGLHLDSKYFDSPNTFFPERFLDKNGIQRYTFMPFGEGPRTCLGQRFAILQLKIGIVHLVKHFEIKVNPKTQLPLAYDPWYFLPLAKGGLWLNFYKI